MATPVDNLGNALAVGDELFVPVTITAINGVTGALTVQTAYSGATFEPMIGSDTHKDGTTWPAIP